MIVASITESVVNWAASAVNDVGLPGVFLLMALGCACIPIPSEVVMLVAGLNVAEHHLTMVGIVLAGVLGSLAGSWVAYAVGYFGRLELVERHGAKLHISPARLAAADRWFARYGAPAVFFTRLIPFIRAFISLPAGVARMPFWRFSVLTLLGSVPWVLGLGLIGKAVRNDWTSWKTGFSYADYVIVALLVIGAAWLIFQRVRGGGRGGRGSQPASDAG